MPDVLAFHCIFIKGMTSSLKVPLFAQCIMYTYIFFHVFWNQIKTIQTNMKIYLNQMRGNSRKEREKAEVL